VKTVIAQRLMVKIAAYEIGNKSMNSFKRLAHLGVAVWLDDLSRSLLQSGDLERMVAEGKVVGVTTNPTIFAKSISAGSGYTEQLQELALRGTAIGEAVRLLTAWDVRAACDVLRSVYEGSDKRDGRVSIEVDPRISADAERTAAEARGLWWLVDRPNLFIKIPATRGGLPAITKSLAEGISINVTLIFSLDRYQAVLDAFMAGLEQRAAKGQDLAGIESVASLFVSRVDTEVDRRLRKIGAADPSRTAELRQLLGQAALANARLAYELYEDARSSDRWKALSAKGAKLQRLLWASTGVKDKDSPATRYVTELVARDTVNTMPRPTLEAVEILDGAIADTVTGRYAEARKVVTSLSKLGVDLADVADVLERQGVASFAQSWDELIKSVQEQLENAGADVMPAGAVTPSAKNGGSSRGPAAAAPARTAAGGQPA
jgi:transaldolase